MASSQNKKSSRTHFLFSSFTFSLFRSEKIAVHAVALYRNRPRLCQRPAAREDFIGHSKGMLIYALIIILHYKQIFDNFKVLCLAHYTQSKPFEPYVYTCIRLTWAS